MIPGTLYSASQLSRDCTQDNALGSNETQSPGILKTFLPSKVKGPPVALVSEAALKVVEGLVDVVVPKSG